MTKKLGMDHPITIEYAMYLARMREFHRIGNLAVKEAQARNRRLGIPNWYSINGRLVSDTPGAVPKFGKQIDDETEE